MQKICIFRSRLLGIQILAPQQITIDKDAKGEVQTSIREQAREHLVCSTHEHFVRQLSDTVERQTLDFIRSGWSVERQNRRLGVIGISNARTSTVEHCKVERLETPCPFGL